jgi:hypothetical protein
MTTPKITVVVPVDDYAKFIDEHDAILRSIDGRFLPDLLFTMWLDLLRVGRTPQRKRVAEYLRLKKISIPRKLMTRVIGKISALAGIERRRGHEIVYV